MRPLLEPTLPNIIAVTLGLCFMAYGAITALQVLWALAVSFGHDIRDWWRARRPDPGWQPRKGKRWPR